MVNVPAPFSPQPTSTQPLAAQTAIASISRSTSPHANHDLRRPPPPSPNAQPLPPQRLPQPRLRPPLTQPQLAPAQLNPPRTNLAPDNFAAIRLAHLPARPRVMGWHVQARTLPDSPWHLYPFPPATYFRLPVLGSVACRSETRVPSTRINLHLPFKGQGHERQVRVSLSKVQPHLVCCESARHNQLRAMRYCSDPCYTSCFKEMEENTARSLL